MVAANRYFALVVCRVSFRPGQNENQDRRLMGSSRVADWDGAKLRWGRLLTSAVLENID